MADSTSPDADDSVVEAMAGADHYPRNRGTMPSKADDVLSAPAGPPPPDEPVDLAPKPEELTSQTPQSAHLDSLRTKLVSLTAQRDSLTHEFLALLDSSSPKEPVSVVSDISTRSEALPCRTEAAFAIKLAEASVKRHIRLLHRYNEIKDLGTGLMGLIADGRGVRVKEVQEEFGIAASD